MTLAQMMELALRQLDEDTADIAEYEALFKRYANEGYRIAAKQYLRPKGCTSLRTNDGGETYIGGFGIGRIIEVCDHNDRPAWFALSFDGEVLSTLLHNAEIHVLHEVEFPQMETATDIPRLPEWTHPAIADYICYRHLSSGNLAKQSRAEFFRNAFYQTMRQIEPQGSGSVTRMKNLYAATDIRRR